MHVILTHEQADFDALAALLGAALLFPEAKAVLPHRMNRNVRAFLNLYSPDLPFFETQDLPREKIDRVTLVDTQSLVTVKGLIRNPQVQVIDHHELRSDLSADWLVTTDKTGACTTLLLEKLIDRHIVITIVQATLLLLGIYEDTGSLTYSRTTSRDIRAIAYLLDHGANLRIAADFLNPPLSNEQRILYETLFKDSESVNINGHTIVIAKARAMDLQDEISSIAHKMRDFLEPDGLFLLVLSLEGLRLIARSTTDQVNVARILGHFGGGGHERAASALMPASTASQDAHALLDAVKTKLVDILSREIQPAVTARQIMSSKPNVIAADTPAASAIIKMQRLGYEGFPVVKDKKVIGLLTRRAVDRAQMHKLNLPASSLMEAGEVFVHPGDAIDVVQQKMAETGWGQIPVIDPETKTVLGIITRTDILRQIAPRNHAAEARKNLSAQLIAALPRTRYELLKVVANKAVEMDMPIFIVGGFVRDLILGHPGSDFDIVVEGDAIALAKELSKDYSGEVVSHGRFGTAKWQIGANREQIVKKLSDGKPLQPSELPENLDLVSARTEFYDHPTALPTIEKGSIKLDLHRRDFTINTLALRLDEPHHGELYDYWDGVNDLRNGVIRVLHALSFIDDPTRILRAIRFEQRFDFKIEPRTLELLRTSRDLLSQVSGSRIRHEFDLIMQERRPETVLQRAQSLDILRQISTHLIWKQEWEVPLRSMLDAEISPIWKLPGQSGNVAIKTLLAYLVWLGHYSADTASRIANHLRFSSRFMISLKAVCQVKRELDHFEKLPPSTISAKLQAIPPLGLAAVYYLAPSKEVGDLIVQYQTRWKNLKIFTDGERLRNLGVPVGPKYRKLLQILRDAWLDGKIHTQAEEEQYLLNLL